MCDSPHLVPIQVYLQLAAIVSSMKSYGMCQGANSSIFIFPTLVISVHWVIKGF